MKRILQIEDDRDYSEALGEFLAHEAPQLEIESVTSLAAGMGRLSGNGIDAVLLDLNVEDSRGLDTFQKVRSFSPNLPIVVLTAADEERLAIETLKRGAQDYLVKDRIDRRAIYRAIDYAIERQGHLNDFQDLANHDPLTRLYNRRGFQLFAGHHLDLARRSGEEHLFFLADLDGLKQINDTFGHREGDRVLVRTAKILLATFRKTDVVARIGGDEFAVLAVRASIFHTGKIRRRLQEKILAFQASEKSYKISLSVGVATSGPHDSRLSLEQILNLADQSLYENKRGPGAVSFKKTLLNQSVSSSGPFSLPG